MVFFWFCGGWFWYWSGVFLIVFGLLGLGIVGLGDVVVDGNRGVIV